VATDLTAVRPLPDTRPFQSHPIGMEIAETSYVFLYPLEGKIINFK
jgi:hypothetical protein